MWKNVKFKKGLISFLLILGLVFTNLNSIGAWAEGNPDVQTAQEQSINNQEAGEAAGEQSQLVEGSEAAEEQEKLKAAREELLKKFDERQRLEDVTDRLENIEVTVVQDGHKVEEGSNIVVGKDIGITVTFKVQVKGDLRQALVKAKTLEDIKNIDINKYIKSDDKAKVVLSKGIKLKDDTNYKDTLKDSTGNKIGDGVFEKDGDRVVFSVAFIGDSSNNIYNGNQYDVTVKGNANFSINTTTPVPNQGEATEIEILGKTYKIDNTYDRVEVTKEGVVNYTDNGKTDYPSSHELDLDSLTNYSATGSGIKSITWTVTASRKDINGQPVSLDGYKFGDDLTSVGDYVPGTFYVGEDKNNLEKLNDEANLYKNKKLSYTFPKDFGPKAVIKFNTALTNYEFRNNFTKKNTAKIYNPSEREVSAREGSVSWTPDWGNKYAIEKDKDSAGREMRFYKEKGLDGKEHYYVDWQIDFNKKGLKLDNVRLIDNLQRTKNEKYGLGFVSAKWKNKNQNEWKSISYGSEKETFKGNHLIYKIGNIDGAINVVIKSEVKKVEDDKLVPLEADKLKERIRFSNWAIMLWGTDYAHTFWAETQIGIGSLMKKIVLTDDKDKGISGVNNEWKITVPASSVKGNTYVYDAFIFKPSQDFGKLKGKDSVLKLIDKDGKAATLKSKIDVKDIIQIHAKYNKYFDVESSFKSVSPDNLQHKVYKLCKGANNEYIGDVVEVWGFSNRNNNEFRLKSVMTGPGNIIRDESGYNIAHIVNDDIIQDNNEAWAPYKSRMLQKQAFNAEVAGKIIDGNNSVDDVNIGVYQKNEGDYIIGDKGKIVKNDTLKRAIDNRSVAYNKEKNSIIYRISVNATGINGVTDYIGNFVLTDELSDSKWRFVPITKDGPMYKIYEGESYSEAYSDDAVVKANSLVTDLSFLNSKIEDRKAVFEFKKLDKPYVILLRATTNDDDYANKSGHLTNEATLTFKQYGNNKVTSTQIVDYNRGVLSKEVISKDISKKYVTWRIDYQPYNFKTENGKVYLKDELGDGLQIRRNADAAKTLAFDDGNYQMFEGHIEKGEFKQDNKVSDEKLKELLSYSDNEVKDEKTGKFKRILTIKIPDRTKTYRFEYVTDIVNKEAGERVNNIVRLMEGGKITNIDSDKAYMIDKAYMSGDSKSLPVITIHKTDETGNGNLENATFRVEGYGTPFDLKTDKDGKVTSKTLPFATYTIKETMTPEGYALKDNDVEFKVKINKLEGGKVQVSLVDNSNPLVSIKDGVITVKNTKNRANFKIVKASSTEKNKSDLDSIERLDGAKFKLTRVGSETPEKVDTAVKGEFAFEGLKAGAYDLEEVEAPEGYLNIVKNTYRIIVDPTKSAGERISILKNVDNQYMSLSSNDTDIKKFDDNVVVFNEKIAKTNFVFYKTDAKYFNKNKFADIEGNLLKGAAFKLTRKDSEDKTTEITLQANDGKYTASTDLVEGTYTLEETEVPENYKVGQKTYTIKVNPKATEAKDQITILKDGKQVESIENEIKFIEGKLVVFNEKEKMDFTLVKADFDTNRATLAKARDESKRNIDISKRTVTIGSITGRMEGVKFSLVPTGTAISDITAKDIKQTAGTPGSITFTGLKSGVYALREEEAINGYVKLAKAYEVVVTTAAVNATAGKEAKDEFAITNVDEQTGVIDNTIVVLNKKTPDKPSGGGDNPIPDPDPTPGPSPSPDPSPNPNPNPPTPTTDLPRYPENNFPDPNDPGSPDEFVAVDDDGTPQGKYVKSKKPDGTNEYIPVDEDGTPLGVNKAKKKLPKTGGSDTTVYYAGGAILLILAAGVVVFRRKKYNR